MKQTQVSLTEHQLAALRQRAHERGVSIAALVREAVDALLCSDRTGDEATRSLAAVGSYRSNPENVAEDHDRFLDEIYSS
ncbi:MAG: CopG family transcriptional regulator [Pseudonocardiaceae bacterium]